MKSLTRFLVLLLLAAGVTLPAGARPARAAVDPATIIAVVEAGVKLLGFLKDLRAGNKSIDQAKAEIINAVNASKTALLAHADALAAAPAKACTRAAVIEVGDMDRLELSALQTWAQSVTSCATQIDSLSDAVTDKAVADQLGFALNIAGPIAILAREKAGLSTGTLAPFLVTANSKVQTKLQPSCTTASNTALRLRPSRVTRCTSYDGRIASAKCLAAMTHCTAGTVPLRSARLEASATTSWRVADSARVVFTGWVPAIAKARAAGTA
ncbi:hypothetical protein DMB66_49170 [Actinoplanes sp. ATCC 53533]|uniref:hypothetical protein n=1 Tax=Actinoplanes sp. ATCC 53533 TaxID=1288362 RepID=UPI000F7674D8|nr:hypothetical protein [Actinoplanes sp. ATCC 53533]RSM46787.1 hypothetical protein DMB66_49170 [Actinoplanes sp. ATCC 53533]